MLRIFFTSILLILSYNASAEINLTCNTCTSYSDYMNSAIAKAKSKARFSSSGYEGNITVLSPLYNKSYTWNIEAKWIMQGGDDPELSFRVNTVAVSADIRSAVDVMSKTEFFKHARQAQQVGIVVPIESGFDSAWALARNSSNHDRFDDWYEAEYPIEYYARVALDIYASIGIPLTNLFKGVEVKFIFSDGSSLRLKVANAQSGDLTFIYIKNSAQDKDGNRIADQGESFSGTYTFGSEESLQNYLNKLSDYGITFTVYRGGEGGSGTVHITDFPKSKE